MSLILRRIYFALMVSNNHWSYDLLVSVLDSSSLLNCRMVRYRRSQSTSKTIYILVDVKAVGIRDLFLLQGKVCDRWCTAPLPCSTVRRPSEILNFFSRVELSSHALSWFSVHFSCLEIHRFSLNVAQLPGTAIRSMFSASLTTGTLFCSCSIKTLSLAAYRAVYGSGLSIPLF